MKEWLGTAAELLGRLVGWLMRVDALSYLFQVAGIWMLVVGIAGWSSEAARIVFGLILLFASFERARR